MKTLGLRELSGLLSILLSLSVFGYFLIYSKYLVTHRSLIVCRFSTLWVYQNDAVFVVVL